MLKSESSATYASIESDVQRRLRQIGVAMYHYRNIMKDEDDIDAFFIRKANQRRLSKHTVQIFYRDIPYI